MMFKSFADVKAKGCVRGEVKEEKGSIKAFVVVCINLGQAKNLAGFQYYCMRDYPEDCSKYGCPKYAPWNP